MDTEFEKGNKTSAYIALQERFAQVPTIPCQWPSARNYYLFFSRLLINNFRLASCLTEWFYASKLNIKHAQSTQAENVSSADGISHQEWVEAPRSPDFTKTVRGHK